MGFCAKKVIAALAVSIVIVGGLSCLCFAGERAGISVSDKEIVEKLIALQEGQKAVDKRFDDLNKRIDDLNKRIDDLNKRIDDLRAEIKSDIGDLRGLLYVILTGMMALIGFVLWDRRTALSPVINRTREIEEREILILRAMKDFALKEPKMAEVLKSLGML